MVHSCCVKTCSNKNYSGKGYPLQFHRFPRDNKLVVEWVRRIGNPSLLGKGKERIYRSYRICDIHFSDECRMPGFSRRSNLKFGSIPTLFLPTCIIGPPLINPYATSDAASENPDNNTDPVLQLYKDLTDDQNSCEINSVSEDVLHDNANTEESILLDNVKQELCRICGNKEHSLTPIFGDTFMTKNLSLPLPRVLEMHLPLQLRADDQCPSNICSKCLNTLSEWHELYVACAAADKAFKNAFCKGKVQDSEIGPSKLQEGEFGSSIDLCTVEDHNYTKNSFEIELQDHDYTRNNFKMEEGIYEHTGSERNKNDIELVQSNISPRVYYIKKYQGEVISENPVCKRLEVTECQQLSIPSEEESGDEECRGSGDKSSNYIQIVFGEEEEREYNFKKSLYTTNGYLDWYERFEGNYPCKYCHELFKQREQRKLHYKVCEKATALCEICGKDVLQKYLYKHKYRNHSVQIICDKCGQYVDKCQLYAHMMSDHSDERYCELCCSILRTNLYSLHMKKHSSGKLKSTFSFNSVSLDGKSVYVCPVCSQRFDDKMSIIIHLNEPKLVKCPTCRFKINSEKKFILHNCKLWNCRFCTKKFYIKIKWREHERIHTGEKPHKCKECNISFRTIGQRANHIRSHRAPAHECKYCSKKFSLRCMLINHTKRIHEGVRFTCEICDKKFTRKFNLKYHLQKHGACLIK